MGPSRFVDNDDTVDGRFVHRYAEKPAGSAPAPGEDNDIAWVARSVPLSSPRLALVARLDIIDAGEGRVRPLERKRGRAPGNPQRSWEPERIQLCAQGLLLRDNGYPCDDGVRRDTRTSWLTVTTAPAPLAARPGGARPFPLDEQGAVIGRDGGRVEVRRKGELLAAVRPGGACCWPPPWPCDHAGPSLRDRPCASRSVLLVSELVFSPVPAAPTVAQLLVLLAEWDTLSTPMCARSVMGSCHVPQAFVWPCWCRRGRPSCTEACCPSGASQTARARRTSRTAMTAANASRTAGYGVSGSVAPGGEPNAAAHPSPEPSCRFCSASGCGPVAAG